MASLEKTPRLNAIPERTPFRIVISSKVKSTGPSKMLKIKPVTIAFNINSNNFLWNWFVQK